MAYTNLILHELSLGAPAKTIRQVEKMAETAASLGANGLEMLYNPQMPAKGIAQALLKNGLKRGALCVANLGDKTGDPLVRAERPPALTLVCNAIERVADLREGGLDIDIVDGPFAFVLGKQYKGNTFTPLVKFCAMVGNYARARDVRLALERLQKSEDGAIRHAERLQRLIAEVGARRSVHMRTPSTPSKIATGQSRHGTL